MTGTLGGSLFGLAVALTSAAVLAVAGSGASDGRQAAGVFPPWWDSSAVFSAASQAGSVRSLGTLPFIVVVRAPEGRVRERLRRAGALFTVAPPGSADCGT